jgi:hypothetical protein
METGLILPNAYSVQNSPAIRPHPATYSGDIRAKPGAF